MSDERDTIGHKKQAIQITQIPKRIEIVAKFAKERADMYFIGTDLSFGALKNLLKKIFLI